jgi:predicted RNA binding protein YcfA (HicA-like mRNA interferase family)
MSGPEKTIRKMRQNPVGWRIEDLMAVAGEHGLEWRRPHGGGSHVIFSSPGVREIVTVPSKRPIKPVYVKHLLALIDAAKGAAN